MSSADGVKTWKTIVGFASYQGFLYSLLYMGENTLMSFGGLSLERVELIVMIACLVGGFAIIRLCSCAVRDALLSSRFVVVYGVLILLVKVLDIVLRSHSAFLVLEGLLAGVPSAFMLCAWVRSLKTWPIGRAVVSVFLSSALGAAVCFVVDAIPVSGIVAIISCLPLVSSLCLRSTETDQPQEFACNGSDASDGPSTVSSSVESELAPLDEEPTSKFTGNVLVGTVVYGIATGLMETYGTNPGAVANPMLGLTLFVFVLYCIAILQTFNEAHHGAPISERFAGVEVTRGDPGPLDEAYRLAVLLMVAGILLIPLIVPFGLPSEAVVLAGYLALTTVLMSLFLAMGHLAGSDCVMSVCRGFSALFIGELGGVVAGNAVGALPMDGARDIVVAIAGIAVMYAYLFLFTDRDLRDLTVAVRRVDRFDEACCLIASRAGLSKRESEILPMALRGRTAERIASELYITKNTVDTHLRRIYSKCDVHTRQELIDLCEDVEAQLVGGK